MKNLGRTRRHAGKPGAVWRAKLALARRRVKPVQKGYQRQWYECSVCGRPQHLDYVPRSLSTPIIIPSCGHDFGDLEERGRPQKHRPVSPSSCGGVEQ